MSVQSDGGTVEKIGMPKGAGRSQPKSYAGRVITGVDVPKQVQNLVCHLALIVLHRS